MQEYASLSQLLSELNSLSSSEWLYANIDVWNTDPKNCAFYYISDDYIDSLEEYEIYLDDEDLEMPLRVKNLHLRTWMTVGDLAHIYEKSDKDIDSLIKGINFYREFDDFL
ncbi:hypothetical protein A4G20_07350 [Pasteurellaceae bacterium RH1A]|nr:hypothetical protein A4G20_07350 [Pasteurellaceae bacterium RH1A]